MTSTEKLNDPTMSTPTVTQSKFYSPAFNAAIFDGPLRIYFAQYQESEALKIYFYMQEKLASDREGVKERLKGVGSNIFLMLYPSSDIFARSFETAKSGIQSDRLGQDFVVGINSRIDEEDYDLLFSEVDGYITATA